jgi:hypothetical protein
MERMKYEKGAICTIHRGEVNTELYAWAWSAHVPLATEPIVVEGSHKAEQRNACVRAALSRGAKWVLFIDSDMVIEMPEMVDIVIRLLDTERPYVSARCVQRGFPFTCTTYRTLTPPMNYRLVDVTPEHGVIPAAAVGTGCVLIRREVFEAVGDPWFEVGQIDPETDAEDIYFSIKATAAGFPPSLDCTVRVGHRFVGVMFPGDDGHVWVRWPGSEDLRSRVPIRENEEAVRAHRRLRDETRQSVVYSTDPVGRNETLSATKV